MSLFKVGTFDCTPFIVFGTYKINTQDMYQSWTDANGITHRVVYRSKTSGQFDVRFMHRADFDMFMSKLASVKVDGYFPVTLYTPANGEQLKNVFIQIDPAVLELWSAGYGVDKFSVKVEER